MMRGEFRVWPGSTSSQCIQQISDRDKLGPGAPALPKMKFEMPRSFTDHPLSRKVEPLKLYATLLYMLSYP